MIQNSGSYKVSIFGDQYTLKTDESHDLILQAAALVDSTMKDIACSTKFDTKSIAVLAALRIAHQALHAGQCQAHNNEALISLIDQEIGKLGFTI
jgi:cell division protein ZapA (FtsZ GTPase activity inhibitor)